MMKLERWRSCWFSVRVNHAFQINPVRLRPLLSAMPVKRVAPNRKQPRTETRTIANLPRFPIYREHHLLAQVFTQLPTTTVRAKEGHQLGREH